MSSEMQDYSDWIRGISPQIERNDVSLEVTRLISETQKPNLLGLFIQIQSHALRYVENEEEIPVGIIHAVNVLAPMPSGYTGLTVYEAYTGWLEAEARKKKNAPSSLE